MCVLVTQLCLTLCHPWTVAHQAPLFMEFSRREYWSGLPFPSPGHLLHWGIKPKSLVLQADSLPSQSPGNMLTHIFTCPILRCGLIWSCAWRFLTFSCARWLNRLLNVEIILHAWSKSQLCCTSFLLLDPIGWYIFEI